MNEVDFLAQEIFSRYGTVKRARGPFLYTAKTVRLTDMYQEGGRAILGWNGDSAWTMFKNALSRGINGSFATDFDYRIQKAVSELLGSPRKVFVYATKEIALENGKKCFPDATAEYRPWTDQDVKWYQVPSVVLAPPLPWTDSLWILALPQDYATESGDTEKRLQDSMKIPAPLKAGIARSIYNLLKAFQERSEKHWFIYDKYLTKYFHRKGPYLYPKIPREKYGDFVLHCLENQIVISPDYDIPSIVPFGADSGVFTKLEKNPFEF